MDLVIRMTRLTYSGGCRAVRIGWVIIWEYGELLLGSRFSMRMKSKVYHGCIRSPILHGNKTLCLKENEKAIFKENEKSYGESHVQSESCWQKDD